MRFAFDYQEIDRIHRIFIEVPSIRRVLDVYDIASLKLAIALLVNSRHTGFLCINVENGNRYLWLE